MTAMWLSGEAGRSSVRIRDVSLRDGLQLVAKVLPTERKLDWCRLALAAGITEMEVTSFVPASVIPQFADAPDVAMQAAGLDGLVPSALVPNLRGAERAIAAGLTKINVVISASDAHNLANVRRTTEQSIEETERIFKLQRGSPQQLVITTGIAMAYGCSLSGPVAPAHVLHMVERLLESGADEIAIADTVGYASPADVTRLLGKVVRLAEDVPVIAHFHDTRGLGMANVTAALEVGVRVFDATIGGLGGCPFAPGASGNIDLEDCVFLAERCGFSTGIALEPLMELRRLAQTWLPNETLGGAIARAGIPDFLRWTRPMSTAS